MSDNQGKIDELMKKLDLLINQQASFSKEINSLKDEIQDINPTASKKVSEEISEKKETVKEKTPLKPTKSYALSAHKVTWPSQTNLNSIKEDSLNIEKGRTKSGTDFIKFNIDVNQTTLEVCLTDKGKWLIGDLEGKVLSTGLYKDDCKTLSILTGNNKNSVVQGSSVVTNLTEAASLSIHEFKKVIVPKTKAQNSADVVEKNKNKPKQKSDLEKYIGENLITVIGIVIIIIGVVFGVKYSIDHNLISITTRIILSYVLGIGILMVGMKLKAKYEQFSAVLVSGGIAIMYFVSFTAYSFELFPQLVAFGLMIFFTIFTVVTAISYNRQIIAHIGLVGSYAIPFLLSDGSGNVFALFTYMAILNTGILIIAFKRHWKSLYYVAFGATWLIFGGWYLGAYEQALHLEIALSFASIFFIMFYATFMVYKLKAKEQFLKEDIVMILVNSSVFYAVCYSLLEQHHIGTQLLGVFTLATGVIHFVVSVILFKTKLADRNLFYLTSGMVLVFLTIAIPVQLEGTWVTLLWGVEASLLFWIGRTKDVLIYERISYVVMAIALGSLFTDWSGAYGMFTNISLDETIFMNITFVTSVIVIASFGFIQYINAQEKYAATIKVDKPLILAGLRIAIPTVLILLIFLIPLLEMNNFWQREYQLSEIKNMEVASWSFSNRNTDILWFNFVWTINYTLIFIAALLFLNEKKLKQKLLQKIGAALGLIAIIIFLTVGIQELNLLQNSFKNAWDDPYFNHGVFNIGIRYICYGFVFLLMYRIYKWAKEKRQTKEIKIVFDLFLHITVLWILCAELINILYLTDAHSQDKLGISILCGLYAILLVIIGIWRNKAHLRIASITLLGLTVLKLFFYDLVHLSTIAKTVVFISLGIIILFVSFMYNKYKHLIKDDEEE